MSHRKRNRIFSPEFKLKIVERTLAGERSIVLAKEFKVVRKLVYDWKRAYLAGGPGALRTRGRPRNTQALESGPEPKTESAELLQARQCIAELERKVGHQQIEIDFFVEALQRIDAVHGRSGGRNAQQSIRSSESKRGKVD
jgi:transposase-like protein